MRYLYARVEEQARVRGYRNYVTDILRVALAPGSRRYTDAFKASETRTAEEIKDSIRSKLRKTDEINELV